MYDRFHEKLAQWVCDDKCNAIMEALTTISTHGSTRAAQGINTIMESAELTTPAEVLDGVYALIHQTQDELFRAFSIEVDDDFTVRNTILTGLLLLDNMEGYSVMTRFTENFEDPEEALANVLEYITTTPADVIHTALKYVSPSLIAKTHNFYSQLEQSNDEPEPILDERWLNRIKAFIAKYPTTHASVMITVDNFKPGTKLSTLLSICRMELALLEPNGPEQAAIELFGLHLISDVGLSLTPPMIKTRLDEWFSDITFISRITSVLDNVIAGVPDNG